MKAIKVVVCALVIASFSALSVSCGGEAKEANPVADSLQGVNSKLSGELTDKEAALQEFVTSFNEIQDNLNTIKEKEKIVSTSTKGGDVKSKEEQIKEDIQAIYDLMAKNKSRLGSMSKKLKDSNVKMEGLEKMLENLQAQLDSKDAEINTLKSQVESLNIELSNLATNYQELESENSVKTEQLNTAYYAFGTSKELKEKGVISKEGGFIGIGKSTKIKEDFNRDYFTKVDVTKTNSINIGAKKAKVLTTHPSSSYKLIGDKTVERIDILNPTEFWSSSKYLVIVTE